MMNNNSVSTNWVASNC